MYLFLFNSFVLCDITIEHYYYHNDNIMKGACHAKHCMVTLTELVILLVFIQITLEVWSAMEYIISLTTVHGLRQGFKTYYYYYNIQIDPMQSTLVPLHSVDCILWLQAS